MDLINLVCNIRIWALPDSVSIVEICLSSDSQCQNDPNIDITEEMSPECQKPSAHLSWWALDYIESHPEIEAGLF